jgi:hypothetical protein
MFTPPENQEDSLADDRDNNEDLNSEELTDEDDELTSDIHTMPEKYLNSAKPSNKKRKKAGRLNWLVLAIIIVVALGAVIVAGVMFLGGQNNPVDNVLPEDNSVIDNQNLNLNQNQNTNLNLNLNQNQNQNQNQNSNVNSQFSLDSVSGRDQQRLKDIADLRTALSLYFKTYQVFPNSIGSLVDQFISRVPVNPQPGGIDYDYLATDGQRDYQLSFSLEEGGDWGVTRLSDGFYYANSQGVFAALEVAEETPDTEPGSELPTLEPVKPGLGLDSDGDQLTDIEELIYQTNSTLADTDGDGFTDASEILGFYDPLKQGGRLMDAGLIEVYQNPNFNYSLLYPKSWVVRSLNTDNKEIIFTSNTGEVVEISVQDNPLGLSVTEWYQQNNPGSDLTKLTSLTIDGFPAIQTTDGLKTYLGVGSNIFSIRYNIGARQQMNFYTTYQLFLKSFIFIQPNS